MGLTHYPHGILATPSLGGSNSTACRFPGLWTNDVLFVDADNGSNDQNGNAPDNALQTIQQAVTNAGVDATIYIRPQAETQGWSDLDPRWGAFRACYVENVLVPRFTKAGLSIIGAGYGWGTSGCSVTMKGVVGVAHPTIDIHAGFVNLENIQFGWAAAQTGYNSAVVRMYNGTSDTGVVQGCAFGDTIVNCSFDRAGYNSTGYAIVVESCAGHLIENNVLDNCVMGIALYSNSTTPDGIMIRGNHFMATASNIKVCITCADVDDVMIVDNYFGHVVPSGGAPNKYIYCAGTAYGHIINNHFCSTQAAITTDNTLSNLKQSGNTGACAGFLTG